MRCFIFWLSVSLLVACAPATSAAPIERPFGASSVQLPDDELTSVCFVNDRLGWAVGVGGILHTDDGGANWKLQTISSLRCRLRAVQFIDEKQGWAVGGESRPITGLSRGVVFRTVDGGATWSYDPTPLLPALRQVGFTSPQDGWAVGESSSFSPSGLFFSRDGGRTWNAAGGCTPHGLLCADFTQPHVGVAATPAGEILPISGRIVHETPVARFGLRAPRRIVLNAQGRGWLVGDGGLVQTTADGGATWRSAGVDASLPVAAQCDWRSVAVRGSQVWIVGSPGSVVLHSPDQGRSWHLLPTGSPLPLNDVAFVDELHGWAVGALGTILRTADGGRSWTNRFDAPRRAALWSCFAEARDVPYELLVQAARGDGYRTAALLFGRREFDETSGDREFTSDRAADALELVGVSSTEQAWGFPLRQASLRVDPRTFLHAWEGDDDADSLRRAEAYLVRQLRTWRPDVVLTHAASPRGEAPTDQLIHQLVVAAVDAAADPARYVDQCDALGLAPWSVKRVFAHLPQQHRGTVVVTTGDLDSRLGMMPADLTATCRLLLLDDATAPPAVAARLVANRSPSAAGDRGLCAGLGISQASDARRLLVPPQPETLLQLRSAAERRRNMQAIAARTGDDGAKIVAQLHDVVVGLEPDRAAVLLFQLAESFRRSGRWEAARETYQQIVTNFPTDALADASLERLVHYLASGEADWRLQRAVIRETAGTNQAGGAAGAIAPIIGYTTDQERRRHGIGVGAFLERRNPAAAAEPTIGFAVASARRRLGQVAEAEQFYDAFVRLHPVDAWWQCAATECPRSERAAAGLQRGYRASRAVEEPLLDGVLDDAAWENAAPLDLRSPFGDDEAWPAAAFITHDDEHLYVAVRCRRAPGDAAQKSTDTRTRDADLAPFDRVDLCLDVDRDFATYYKLSVDCRGWTNDSCWGDATWDPTWYVATGGDETTWIVEAAIPWSELVPKPPQPGDVWSCGIQRLAPTAGLQSWTQPADITIRPEGFGRLSFEK